MSKLASALTSLEGKPVALCDVAVSAVLQDLLAEVTISQTYRNDERVNIEAVYTFPLPLDAVLLELEVDIGGRVLKGVVVEKKAAEEKYEDAVEAGDAAVMLETIEPGLYTMNVGNLLPQESAKITLRYAILYKWSGDRLRFFLPTTIAPRFGESPHLAHQTPAAALAVENQFSLRMEFFGALRDAQFDCPSHAVELLKSEEKAVLSLRQRRAVMDRDFLLNVKAPQAARSFVLFGQDGEGMAAVASFQPFFPGLQQPRPLNLAIVIDCSRSMQGDSIDQAKQALEGILDGLQPHDRIALIAFGSTTKLLSDRPLSCNQTNVAAARRFARALQANLGGTEIGRALDETYLVASRLGSADIFLITDGEVADWGAIVQKAKQAGHRIFTVGVGSAVSEAFVRELALGTGGACELVSPREAMADRVVRHFERMRTPRAKRVAVRWPEGAANITPTEMSAVFEGDTVVTCAHFDHAPGGAVILEVEGDSGDTFRQELAFPAGSSGSADGLSTVARLAAAARLKELDEVQARESALHYRLVSRWTNWLVVAPRTDEEKAQDLPALRKVPQTPAAGWGGVGSVAMPIRRDSMVVRDLMPSIGAMDFASMEAFDLTEAQSQHPGARLELPEPCLRLLELVDADASRLDPARALDLLTQCSLTDEFDALFQHTADFGLSVHIVAAIVLARILGGPLGEFLSRDAQLPLASLQQNAQEATDALREMARHGLALVRLTREPVAREVLRQRTDDEVLERFARISDLLEHLDDDVREFEKRQLRERGRDAPRRRTPKTTPP